MTALNSAFKHVKKKLWPDPPKQNGISSLDLRPILNAAFQSNLKELRFFLKKYEVQQLLSVTSNIHNGHTLLHAAAKKGDVAVLGLLLDEGAPIHWRDGEGSTPLHIAAAEGKKDAITLLLEHGADVNARDHVQRRPLAAAARRGHRDTVELLLDRGAQIDGQDLHGWCALHEAMDHPGTLKALLDRGANAELRTKEGLTPLMLICCGPETPPRGHCLAQLLQHGAETDLRDAAAQTPLDIAVAAKNNAFARRIESEVAEREANRVRLTRDVTVRRIRFRQGGRRA